MKKFFLPKSKLIENSANDDNGIEIIYGEDDSDDKEDKKIQIEEFRRSKNRYKEESRKLLMFDIYLSIVKNIENDNNNKKKCNELISYIKEFFEKNKELDLENTRNDNKFELSMLIKELDSIKDNEKLDNIRVKIKTLIHTCVFIGLDPF